jgi:hypothetical protein
MGLVHAYIIIYAALVIPIYYFSARNMNLRLRDFLKNLLPILISTSVMSIIVILIKVHFQNQINITNFTVQILSGIISYFLILIILRRKISLIKIIFEQ